MTRFGLRWNIIMVIPLCTPKCPGGIVLAPSEVTHCKQKVFYCVTFYLRLFISVIWSLNIHDKDYDRQAEADFQKRLTFINGPGEDLQHKGELVHKEKERVALQLLVQLFLICLKFLMILILIH